MRAYGWTAFVLFGLFCRLPPGLAAGLQTLEIASKTGVHVFAVEIADTEADARRRA